MRHIYYIKNVYIYFFLLISLLSLSFCVCLLAFFSSRDLVFISTFMLLCLESEKIGTIYVIRKKKKKKERGAAHPHRKESGEQRQGTRT